MTVTYLKHLHQQTKLEFYKVVEDTNDIVILLIQPSIKGLSAIYSQDIEHYNRLKELKTTVITKDEFDAACNAAILTMIEISTL